MDHPQPTPRSASQGPLDHNYTVKAQRRSHTSPSPSRTQLRAKAAPFLLTSPAPLESMLRKTTETGDIGLFSIDSIRSVSASHVSRSPKSAWSEPTIAKPSPASSVRALDLIDDRRSLPSYRGSMSETVSVEEYDGIYSQSQSRPSNQGTRSGSPTISMEERAEQLSPIEHVFRGYSTSEETLDGLGDEPVPGPPPATPTSLSKTRQVGASD
jgi:hypothetical protein